MSEKAPHRTGESVCKSYASCETIAQNTKWLSGAFYLPSWITSGRNLSKLNSATFHCLIFVCVHVHASTHICVHMCACTSVFVEGRGWHLVSSSIALYLIFRDKVSRWTRDLMELLGWLVSEKLRCSCCRLSTGLETGAAIFYLICGHWRFSRGPQAHTRDPSSHFQPSLISIIIVAMPFPSISEYPLLYLSQLSFSFVRSMSLIHHTFPFPVRYIKICPVPSKLIVPYK